MDSISTIFASVNMCSDCDCVGTSPIFGAYLCVHNFVVSCFPDQHQNSGRKEVRLLRDLRAGGHTFPELLIAFAD